MTTQGKSTCSGPSWMSTPETNPLTSKNPSPGTRPTVVPIQNTVSDNGPTFTAVVPKGMSGCGVKRISPLAVRLGLRDLNRRETLFGEYPWVVALYRKIEGFWEYICVGSLISEDTVLTAAHCLEDSDGEVWPENLRVVAGEWDLKGEREPTAAQAAEVKEIIRHEGFSRASLTHDIALVRLNSPLALGTVVDVICLGNIFDVTQCRAAGWAPLMDRDGHERRTLTQVQVPLVSHEECETALRDTHLGSFFRLHSSFICAGAAKRDTCKGDGGGPLMCLGPGKRMIQVGIVSWGVDCGSGLPGVYANVPFHYDWIQKHANLSQAVPPN